MRYTREGAIERFWRNVEKGDGCWNWTGRIDKGGYGDFTILDKRVRAHRMSWEISFGEIPRGLWVLHRCDNRRCVNPAHLWIGDVTDNNNDRDAKGRHWARSGESHGRAKLTERDVAAIRASRKSFRGLAREYGVSESQVRRIVHGEQWSSLGGAMAGVGARYEF